MDYHLIYFLFFPSWMKMFPGPFSEDGVSEYECHLPNEAGYCIPSSFIREGKTMPLSWLHPLCRRCLRGFRHHIIKSHWPPAYQSERTHQNTLSLRPIGGPDGRQLDLTNQHVAPYIMTLKGGEE